MKKCETSRLTSYLNDERSHNQDQDLRLATALKRGRLSNQRQLLCICDTDIAKWIGGTLEDASELKHNIAKQLIPRGPTNALQMFKDESLQHWRLSSGCPRIDTILKGGLLSGVITEISGESASGKTQICLQLCLSVQLNQNHRGGAVYICTEDRFPSKRLQQLIRFQADKGIKFGDNIFIEHIADFESLDECVEKRLPSLLARGLARLVVIDSVAALFRCHYSAAQSMERAQHLKRFAGTLHRLAVQHDIPLVCVNQVTATMGGRDSVIPSLGLAWANQISCRIMIRRAVPPADVNTMLPEGVLKSTSLLTFRELSVVFAPHLAAANIVVYIDDAGFHGL